MEGMLRLCKLFRNSQKAWERNLDFYTARTDKSSSGSHLGLKGRETLLRLPVLAFLVCGQRAGVRRGSPDYLNMLH